jgi:DivIVA domain-containing protein
MPVSPAEVRDVVFSQPPVGKLGYHEDEVDEFLDLVHAELTRLVEENNALRDQVEQFDQQLRAAPGGTGRSFFGSRRSGGSVMTRIRSLIGHQSPRDVDDDLQASTVACAEDMADLMTTQAHAEADRTLGQAQAHCAYLISEAVETMLREARSTAETLHRQSREQAALLEQDAARTHAETLAVFNHDKTFLENTIDDLRGFEQEYRSHLTLYLQSLLDELDGPTLTAPADPIHPGRDLVSSGLGARGDIGQSSPG